VDRCPVCRAVLKDGPACRRCRADLSVLFRIEEEAEGLLRKAARSLAGGNLDAAEAVAGRAVMLQATDRARALQGFIRLLQGSAACPMPGPPGHGPEKNGPDCQGGQLGCGVPGRGPGARPSGAPDPSASEREYKF